MRYDIMAGQNGLASEAGSCCIMKPVHNLSGRFRGGSFPSFSHLLISLISIDGRHGVSDFHWNSISIAKRCCDKVPSLARIDLASSKAVAPHDFSALRSLALPLSFPPLAPRRRCPSDSIIGRKKFCALISRNPTCWPMATTWPISHQSAVYVASACAPMLAFSNSNVGRNPSMASVNVFFSSCPSALSDKESRAISSMNSINRSAPSFVLIFFQSSILDSSENDFVIAYIRAHQGA